MKLKNKLHPRQGSNPGSGRSTQTKFGYAPAFSCSFLAKIIGCRLPREILDPAVRWQIHDSTRALALIYTNQIKLN